MKASLLLAIAIATAVPAYAAEQAAAANRYAATIAPIERFEVDSMLVERHGQHGRPLILIPGLASGSWTWQSLVRELSGDHVLYLVTLPGFDGRAAVPGWGFEQARKALAQLIASRQLDKPVLIGHSLGATLSLAVAQQQPALVAGVVAIDGLPVFPGTELVPAEQRVAMAQSAKAGFTAPGAPPFATQQQRYMREIGVLDMGKADELARLTARSDPGAVANYMAEVLSLDLRPGLAKISAPVLLLAPYFDADAAQQQISQDDKIAYYKSLMAGTPKLEVVPVSPSRHFAMFDQPEQVADAIRHYLGAL